MLEDLDAMLSLFSKVVSLHHVDMTGYAILPSQIDLLITPRNSAEDVSKFTQAFCRLYSRYFNDAYRRSGALWHGRFRSCVVQGKRPLFKCTALYGVAAGDQRVSRSGFVPLVKL